MREIITKIYSFDELSDKAKVKARDWWRGGMQDDSFWSENVIEDAKHVFSLAGFTIDRVFFSGFSSQGDGACFEGSWKASDVKPGQLKKECPKDEKLHRIAREMERIAKEFPGASMKVKHRGHYSHKYETVFDVSLVDKDENTIELPAGLETSIIETSRDAMEWIYRTLESEWNYQNADEQVDENIRDNEYEFTADGNRWVTPKRA